MDRKEFFRKSLLFSAAGSSLLFFNKFNAMAVEPTHLIPCEKKVEFMHGYIKNLMDFVDNELDEKERKKFMLGAGRRCYLHGRDPKGFTKVSLNEYIEKIKKAWGENAIKQEGNTIFLKFQTGDKKAECACPMVTDINDGLSKTYCNCTAGYVKSMFEFNTDKTVEVELIETIKWGGAVCSLKITVN